LGIELLYLLNTLYLEFLMCSETLIEHLHTFYYIETAV